MDKKLEDLISIIERLLRLGDHQAVIEACNQSLEKFPHEPRLWNLLGCSLGATGQHRLARTCFLSALNILGFDCPTIVNLVTSTFAVSKTKLACRILDHYFDELCEVCKRNIIEAVLEAIRDGQLDRNTLPQTVKAMLENIFPI